MLEIRLFMRQEWSLYRDIRLASLEDTPDAFGSTFERSRQLADAGWQRRLSAIDPAMDYPVAAFDDDLPVALAWGRMDSDEREKVILNQMWTHPDYRGRGLARKLVESVIDWAHTLPATTLELSVTQGNTAAKRLYISVGFVETGKTEPLREGSSKTVEVMQLALNQNRDNGPR